MAGNSNFSRGYIPEPNSFSKIFFPRNSWSVSSSTSSSSSSSADNSPLSDQSPAVSPGIGEVEPASSAMQCNQCLRQGAPLFCFACGFWMANGRVAQPCSRHPKVIFYTDFRACPKCKKVGHLRELD